MLMKLKVDGAGPFEFMVDSGLTAGEPLQGLVPSCKLAARLVMCFVVHFVLRFVVRFVVLHLLVTKVVARDVQGRSRHLGLGLGLGVWGLQRAACACAWPACTAVHH